MNNFAPNVRGPVLALALAVAAGLAPAIVQANMIVPAKNANGTVTAIDAQKGEVTVDGRTFSASAAHMKALYVGAEVRIQYLQNGDELFAISVLSPRAPNPEPATGE